MKQINNARVWYHNPHTETIRCVANVLQHPSSGDTIIKMITLRKCGGVDVFAVGSDNVGMFFKGHNRIATKKQLQLAFSRVYSILDGDASGFISKWEEFL